MADWGGKRTPRNPAPVSGPGRMSRRTDGGPQQTQAEMTGMGYGENKDFQEIQSSAPLAASGSVRAGSGRGASGQSAAVTATPLFAPTAYPDEPVTAGSDVGPGPGFTPMMQQSMSLADTLAKLLPYDETGDIRRFYDIATSRGW